MTTTPACKACGKPIPDPPPGRAGRPSLTCSHACKVSYDRQRYQSSKARHAAEIVDRDRTIDALRLRIAVLEGELLALRQGVSDAS